ncbi:UNVERIFIED_CONTAM: Retrovirus-related Pol polyprotein from transposon RE2 [Sesamum radiatum]|uniref:Retrovirus-related Pol polyprotein from transposon RE2 n=1 Tax=Sesamum radiatum TaxID=300843 RepID=A0AAW2VRH8_SESRA
MAADQSSSMVEVALTEKNRRDSDLESSGMIFVSSPLNDDNYLVWSRAMRFALGSRMKLSFIHGRSVRPPEGSDDLDERIRKDYLVVTWILNNVSKTIVDAFMYVTSARSLWLELEARYGKSNGPMIYNLEREISSISQEHKNLIAREVSHQLMQFLMGLSSPYANVRSQILVMDPRPDVTKAFAMLLNVEKELQVQTLISDTSKTLAFKVEHKDDQGTAQNLYHLRTKPLHGTPEWYKELSDKRKKGGGRGRGAFAGALSLSNTHMQNTKDSEASISSMLRSGIKKLLKEENVLAEGQHTPLDMVHHINFAEIHEFAVNLLSVSQICASMPVTFSFTSTYCILQDLRTKENLAIGKLIGKLYILDNSFSVCSNSSDSVLLSTSNIVDSTCNDSLWHLRLSHSSYQVNSIFDLVHMDLWGPYKTTTVSGCCYFLTIVDHFSRNTWTYLLKHKSQAVNCISLPSVTWLILSSLVRDVLFYESTFPFSSGDPIQPTHCPIPLMPHSTVDACAPPSPNDAVPAPSSTITTSISQSPIVSPTISTNTSPTSISPAPTPLPSRRSTRVSVKPSWMTDFYCQLNCTTSTYMFTGFSSAYTCFVASLSALQEPRSYKKAAFRKEWTEAMNAEILALERNQTWEITKLPPRKKAIGCKWVFRLKLKEDGTVDRYKARLVAKGYTQVEGVDYVESFSPVAKAVTVRLLLAVAAAQNWEIHQLDVNNAFLHGHLDEEIFMTPPEGYQVAEGSQSCHDHCLFTKGSQSDFVALLVYVDDVLVVSPSLNLITAIKQYLDELFTIKDLGVARYFLGLQIARSTAGLSLTQSKYIHDILSDTGLLDAKSVTTPLPQGVKLCAESGSFLPDPEPYRRLIDRLLYLGFTRPDISYGIQQLSQFLLHPCTGHWAAALHLVRYLKGTPHTGLFFPSSSSFEVRAYCDADWVSCLDTRRSISGFCIFLGSARVSWKSKKRATVSRSPAEVEYRSLAATVCELQWVSYILPSLGVSLPLPIPLFCDNEAALHIMANPVFHERTKHLDIDCHVVRNQYRAGFVLPSFVRSKEQLADLFTKNVSGPLFATLLSKTDLFSLFPSPSCGG